MMAEKGETRDKSSHRTPGQIKRMNAGYDAKPSQIQKRVELKKGRRMLGLAKGDPRDAAHIKPARHGGAATKANLRPLHRSKNRGWRDGGDK